MLRVGAGINFRYRGSSRAGFIDKQKCICGAVGKWKIGGFGIQAKNENYARDGLTRWSWGSTGALNLDIRN
jgi:hypothetical protein